MKLSPRQRQVLDFINSHLKDKGYPPTIRDIGAAMGIRSTNAVNDHLAALEKKGAISRDRACSRGISILGTESHAEARPRPVEVPVLGRIAAGVPLLAEENVLEHVTVDPGFIPRSAEVFGLRVVGDSMIGDGIHENDVILVRRRNIAENGEIVVALVDGEATVKRFFREKDRIRLQPSNDKMDPIYILESDARDTLIQGVVVAVFRKL